LACVSSGSTEEANFVLCIEGDAVSEAWKGSIAKHLELLEGHLFENLISYYGETSLK
jgi:hypothetical protein